MARGYLEIDGKRIELTDKQVEQLLKDKEESDLFKRKNEKKYHYIDSMGEVLNSIDNEYGVDNKRYKVANYCTDKELMKQRALHETLDRLLWRFSMENDGDKINWSGSEKNKYMIYYDTYHSKFEVNSNATNHYSFVYFYTKEIAKRAINEIIIPFMEEHPEFVW